MTEAYFFEDVVVGAELRSSTVAITREDVIDFARKWDPLPIHLDDSAAQAAGFGSITASGTHLLAIKHRLLYDFAVGRQVVARANQSRLDYGPLNACFRVAGAENPVAAGIDQLKDPGPTVRERAQPYSMPFGSRIPSSTPRGWK